MTGFFYDDPADNGFLSRVVDAESRQVSFDYDGAGRVATQFLPDLETIGFTYDLNGNLDTLTPPGRTAHGFGYTPIDLVDTYDPPDVAGIAEPSTIFTYNKTGDLDLVTLPSVTLPASDTIDPQYDFAGRLETLVHSSGPTTFVYDDVDTDGDPATGQLEQITAPGPEVLTFSYDGFLLEDTVWSGTIGGTVMRDYDSFLRLSGEQVLNFDTGFLTYSYDLDGLLTGAGDLSITRDPHGGDANGLIATTTLASVGTVHTYNPFGELDTFTAGTLYSEDVSQRDALGRITRKVETISGVPTTTDYIYDADTGRLETVTLNGAPTPSRHYRYDANGNRLSFDPLDATQIAFYDAQDRLTSYGTTDYTYTANGELETKTQNGTDLTSYTYETLGNLTQVILPDDRTISYVIDGRNRRMGKKVDGALVQGFLYRDALNPVAELGPDGMSVVSRFMYGTKPHVPDYMVKGGVTYRILSDHLGSVRLVVNATTGAVAQQIDYDDFGNVTLDTNSGFQPFGFAGGLYDPDTGLVRFGARNYDPEVGRWTAKDPIRFDGNDPNLYSYAANDPVNALDPDGRFNVLTAGLGAAAGGLVNGALAAARGESFGRGFAVGATAGAIAGFTLNPAALGFLVGGSTAAGNILAGIQSSCNPALDIALGAGLGAVGGAAGAAFGAGAAPTTAAAEGFSAIGATAGAAAASSLGQAASDFFGGFGGP